MKLALMTKRTKPALNLKNRSLPPLTESDDFRSAVLNAIEVTQELNAVNTQANRKMSANAIQREIIALVRSSPKRIADLRKSIEAREPGLHETWVALRQMMRAIRDPNMSWLSVPKDPSRLKFLSTEASNRELALRQYTYVELFCVAVQIAAEKFPECFGTCDDSAAWSEHVEKLHQRQRQLFSQIATSLTSDDIHVGKVESNGLAPVGFKMSDGKVPIAPLDNAGERLVNYLIANGTHRT